MDLNESTIWDVKANYDYRTAHELIDFGAGSITWANVLTRH